MDFSAVNLSDWVLTPTLCILQRLTVSFLQQRFPQLNILWRPLLFILNIIPTSFINTLFPCLEKHSDGVSISVFPLPLVILQTSVMSQSPVFLSEEPAGIPHPEPFCFFRCPCQTFFWIISCSIMPFLRCEEKHCTYYSVCSELWIDTEANALQCSLFHSW